jgi:ABC-type sugar transport system substrate-binding protein
MMTSDQSGKRGYLRQVTAAAAFMACALAATPGQAADRLGVTLPTVSGPWYTNILYGITDEAQKHDYEVTILVFCR